MKEANASPKDAALRLALRAMESFQNGTNGLYEGEFEEEITAIKAALEARDEPYAFEASMYSNDRVKIDPVTGNVSIGTPERTWVALTDEEIDKAWRSVDHTIPYAQFRIDVAKAVEAKLKEKNT
jgi:hypothetical protein